MVINLRSKLLLIKVDMEEVMVAVAPQVSSIGMVHVMHLFLREAVV